MSSIPDNIRYLLTFVGAVLLPYLIVWIALFSGANGNALSLSGLLALIIGVASIAILPRSQKVRIWTGVIYTPVLYIGTCILMMAYLKQF